MTVAAWDKLHGYDRSELAQFVSYLGRLVRGNFGYSYVQIRASARCSRRTSAAALYLSGASLVLS